jgi:tetratricopeptide (TPR) repeat protein
MAAVRRREGCGVTRRAQRRLAALLACVCLAFLPSCEGRHRQGLDRAEELAFQGRYEEALYALDEVLAGLGDARDGESRALRLRALSTAGRIAHLFLRRPERAIAYYRAIAESYPDSDEAFDARERMARIHVESGDRAGALAHYQALVAGFMERPGVDRYQYELARSYFTLGDHEQARTEARHLLESWPETEYAGRVRMLVATSYQTEGRLEEAVAAFRVVRELHADSDLAAHALFEEAGCLSGLDRKEEAMAAYLRALEKHPEPALVRMRLERLRARMQRRDLEHLGPAWGP